MSIMVIWLMSVSMDHESWLILAIVIIIILLAVILGLWSYIRKRDGYNLEYPQDFQSSADEDMRDRFSGRHYK